MHTVVLPPIEMICDEQAAYTAVAEKARMIAAMVFICCVPERIILH